MSEQTPASNRRRLAVGLVALTAGLGVAVAAGALSPAPQVQIPVAVPPLASVSPSPALGAKQGPSAAAPSAAAAGHGVTLAARLDRSRVMQGGDGIVRAELTLSAAAPEGDAPAVPTDIIVVIDRSSSMSGQKFADAMGAMYALLGRLRPADRLSVVSYSGDARVDVALAPATPEAVAGWRGQLGRLSPGGSTNISAALDLADGIVRARESERPARVLLLSDGEPTAGDTGADGLTRRARRAAERGYVLSAVGIGLGFNEVLMAGLADAGTGNFHSLHDEGGLDAILAAEFDASRATVASGLAVELKPAAGVAVVDAAGYPMEHIDGGVVFRPGALFAGQARRIWLTLRVPADQPADAVDLGAVGLRFAVDGAAQALPPAPLGAVAAVADEAAFVAGLDAQAWERSVVAGRFADIEKKLAVHVRNGEADAARALLDTHATQTAALNRVVGSVAVEQHLGEVAARRAALDDAFSGANQAHKRNRFSKMNLSSGWSSSRGGALSNVFGR